MYKEDYLLLSGIQHFYFCKRQWGLIHLQQEWAENESTILGNILHEKADKPYIKEKRKDLIISRAMPVSSKKLGLSGILDIVEFYKSDNGIKIENRKGLWQARIIEYKKGKAKKDLRDIVQLVAQVIALEEEMEISIDKSYIYYFQSKNRLEVEITDDLRKKVESISKEMHQMFEEGLLAKAENNKNCRLCSLVDICMPKITKKKKSIDNYLYGD